jgi:hypothetical protein
MKELERREKEKVKVNSLVVPGLELEEKKSDGSKKTNIEK